MGRELARLRFLAPYTVQDELAKLEAADLIVSRSNGYKRSPARIQSTLSTGQSAGSWSQAPLSRIRRSKPPDKISRSVVVTRLTR